MAYTVKITYIAPEAESANTALPIASMFVPCGSYVDSAVMVDGGPIRDPEDKQYEKSIYATNVDGWGSYEVQEPFATTSIPLSVPMAQFKLATVADQEDEKGNKYVEFDVEDYKEAFYYKELGLQMADQGFIVEVASKN